MRRSTPLSRNASRRRPSAGGAARPLARAAAMYATDSDDASPELALLNLVDLMLVFAVGLMIALVSYYGLESAMLQPEATIVVQSPNQEDVEVIVKKPDHIERMKLSRESLAGEGVRIGAAYRLKSGEIVYVPEADQTNAAAISTDHPSP